MRSKRIPFLDLAQQYRSIHHEINSAIRGVVRSGIFIGGPQVTAFEREFSAFVGVDFCVGVGNGTDALEIAIEALQLEPNSEILIPANSFIASSEAVTRSGHRVKFVDVEPDTHLVDFAHAESLVSSSTKAIIIVHLYGRPVSYSAVKQFAAKCGLIIIEDCAQAHGASSGGRSVGTYGDIAAFSFYPGKNLGAYGDAGAVLTSNFDLAKRVRMIANHGRVDKYDHIFEGRNSRLDSLQAAILRVKLQHLRKWMEKRSAVAGHYFSLLSGTDDLILPRCPPSEEHAYHLFVIQTIRRDELKDFLSRRGIESGVHYPHSLPTLEAYRYLEQSDATPVANGLAGNILSLPMGDHLTKRQVKRVATAVREFHTEYQKS